MADHLIRLVLDPLVSHSPASSLSTASHSTASAAYSVGTKAVTLPHERERAAAQIGSPSVLNDKVKPHMRDTASFVRKRNASSPYRKRAPKAVHRVLHPQDVRVHADAARARTADSPMSAYSESDRAAIVAIQAARQAKAYALQVGVIFRDVETAAVAGSALATNFQSELNFKDEKAKAKAHRARSTSLRSLAGPLETASVADTTAATGDAAGAGTSRVDDAAQPPSAKPSRPSTDRQVHHDGPAVEASEPGSPAVPEADYACESELSAGSASSIALRETVEELGGDSASSDVAPPRPTVTPPPQVPAEPQADTVSTSSVPRFGRRRRHRRRQRSAEPAPAEPAVSPHAAAPPAPAAIEPSPPPILRAQTKADYALRLLHQASQSHDGVHVLLSLAVVADKVFFGFAHDARVRTLALAPGQWAPMQERPVKVRKLASHERTGNNAVPTIAALGQPEPLVVTGAFDGSVLAFGLRSRTKRRLDGATDAVLTVAVGAELIASGSADMGVNVYTASSGAPLCRLKSHTSYVRSVAIVHSRVISVSDESGAQLWDVSTPTAPWLVAVLHEDGFPRAVQAVALESAEMVALVYANGSVRIWTVDTQLVVLTLHHTAPVADMAWDAVTAAVLTTDGSLVLWDVADAVASRASESPWATNKYSGVLGTLTLPTGTGKPQAVALDETRFVVATAEGALLIAPRLRVPPSSPPRPV
ncbi:uncharacterized protein AMSG_09101 [Thecamonas trahens ATCC 50062]|uniref:Uncharacterized protein n=1 Tax=Thecamonas trahens ATCC 50062 TaxID=461836 RepID=A0A0L0DKN1_THETB|nr:hypothetical protein AMSG_09101 [Thecamonas trahens ATCC 50062]KNC52934.1 hypothetical protein AMSG_09101 [Thecamonas trahens ATCC 50062]|eukprot:XP_013754829.1 hypothetical protein AMSG_09101 [Thecamonas trahens ATCC 50062]